MNVGKLLAESHSSLYMRQFTLGRSPISVIDVEKALGRSHNSLSMRQFILGRSPISVTNVGKPLPGSHTSLSMLEFTLARSLINVINVEKPLAGSHTSTGIRLLTREESFEGRNASSEIKPQETSENACCGKIWQRLGICPPRQIFSDTASFSLPLPVASISQISVEIQTQVMNFPSRPGM
jgi:hypothetical protein